MSEKINVKQLSNALTKLNHIVTNKIVIKKCNKKSQINVNIQKETAK